MHLFLQKVYSCNLFPALRRRPKDTARMFFGLATMSGAGVGAVLGLILSIIAIVFGTFACVPAGPFEKQNLSICISFILLSGLGVVAGVVTLIGMFAGLIVDFVAARLRWDE